MREILLRQGGKIKNNRNNTKDCDVRFASIRDLCYCAHACSSWCMGVHTFTCQKERSRFGAITAILNSLCGVTACRRNPYQVRTILAVPSILSCTLSFVSRGKHFNGFVDLLIFCNARIRNLMGAVARRCI